MNRKFTAEEIRVAALRAGLKRIAINVDGDTIDSLREVARRTLAQDDQRPRRKR